MASLHFCGNWKSTEICERFLASSLKSGSSEIVDKNNIERNQIMSSLACQSFLVERWSMWYHVVCCVFLSDCVIEGIVKISRFPSLLMCVHEGYNLKIPPKTMLLLISFHEKKRNEEQEWKNEGEKKRLTEKHHQECANANVVFVYIYRVLLLPDARLVFFFFSRVLLAISSVNHQKNWSFCELKMHFELLAMKSFQVN